MFWGAGYQFVRLSFERELKKQEGKYNSNRFMGYFLKNISEG